MKSLYDKMKEAEKSDNMGRDSRPDLIIDEATRNDLLSERLKGNKYIQYADPRKFPSNIHRLTGHKSRLRRETESLARGAIATIIAAAAITIYHQNHNPIHQDALRAIMSATMALGYAVGSRSNSKYEDKMQKRAAYIDETISNLGFDRARELMH